MQRAAIIALLALVACANAQLFQQNYDFRGSLQYKGPADASIPFAGELQYLPPAEFVSAVRVSTGYTQTVRPARDWILAIDSRTGSFSQTQVTVGSGYLIVAAVSENSRYREGEVIIVNGPGNGPCFDVGVPMALNAPLPHSKFTPDMPTAGVTSCMIKESDIVATLTVETGNSADALGLQNFRYIRRDRTVFGPTVF